MGSRHKGLLETQILHRSYYSRVIASVIIRLICNLIIQNVATAKYIGVVVFYKEQASQMQEALDEDPELDLRPVIVGTTDS